MGQDIVLLEDVYYVDPAAGAVARGNVIVHVDGKVTRQAGANAAPAPAGLTLKSSGRHIVLPGLSNLLSSPVELKDASADLLMDAVVAAISTGLTQVTFDTTMSSSELAKMLQRAGVRVNLATKADVPFSPVELVATKGGRDEIRKILNGAGNQGVSHAASLSVDTAVSTLAGFALSAEIPLERVATLARGGETDLVIVTLPSGVEHDAASALSSALCGTPSVLASLVNGRFVFRGTDANTAFVTAASSTQSEFEFDTVGEAIEAIKRGEFVVVVDNEDRENEGDLIIAGEFMTPEKMAFMIRHTSALICVSLPAQRTDELNLPLMVTANNESFKTAFTVSIDFLKGTTTGISASDRSATCAAVADLNCRPEDFARPGHIFPLRYQEGGVLTRTGHTEAAGDLCMMAGVYPAGVLCEVALDSGSMARRDYLRVFSRLHGLPMISIADMIKYRNANGLQVLTSKVPLTRQ